MSAICQTTVTSTDNDVEKTRINPAVCHVTITYTDNDVDETLVNPNVSDNDIYRYYMNNTVFTVTVFDRNGYPVESFRKVRQLKIHRMNENNQHSIKTFK